MAFVYMHKYQRWVLKAKDDQFPFEVEGLLDEYVRRRASLVVISLISILYDFSCPAPISSPPVPPVLTVAHLDHRPNLARPRHKVHRVAATAARATAASLRAAASLGAASYIPKLQV